MSARVRPAHAIRRMRDADIAEILAIERASYRYPWNARIFHDCLRVGYRGWCATDDAPRVIGYGLISSAAAESHVLNICVAAAARGTGVADSLLNAMIEQARRDQAQTLLLEVRPSNRAARRLYKRRGFACVGRRPRYYPAENGREDALLLSLPVV